MVDVMQSGYMIGDRCLRPALVAVAKGGAKPSQAARATATERARKAANDDFPDGDEARLSRVIKLRLTAAWSRGAK